MNDIDELKRFVLVHARAQDIPADRYTTVLARISTDAEGAAGSWAVEWTRAGDELTAAGQLLDAVRCYNMARFPFVDGPTRESALLRCTTAFDKWRQAAGPITRLTVDVDRPKGQVTCWTAGLSAERPPLMIMMGGIVSIKEQWAPLLTQAAALGMAMIVTEMPGVGENTLAYDEDSWRMLPALLDTVADRADVAHTYAVAMSFSGHLALRAAAVDQRIRGIVTAGPPIRSFFTDAAWQSRLPRVTVDTLRHLTGRGSDAELFGQLRGWALSEEELSSLAIPVSCTVSSRDEIIPPEDAAVLRSEVARADTNEFDDVHASPAHVDETRAWTLQSLLRMRAADA